MGSVGGEEGFAATQTADLGIVFIKMLCTFGALILLLFATYWFVRKFIQFRLEKGSGLGSIHILEKKMVSPKTMLYLIEVENKKVLIAESHLEVKRIETFSVTEV